MGAGLAGDSQRVRSSPNPIADIRAKMSVSD